jgi:chromosome segregation ATPase
VRIISSLSTLLLDAAIAGKPFIQYETENEYSYRFCTPTPLEDLAYHLKDRSRWNSVDADKFRQHYADAEDGRFYQRLAEVLATSNKRSVTSTPVAVTYSLGAQVEQLWNSLYQERRAFAVELQRITNEAEARLAQQRHRLEAVTEERLAEQKCHLETVANHHLAVQQQELRAEAAKVEAKLQEQGEWLTREAERLTKKIATLESRISQKDAALKKALASLEAMRSSTSWRVTAPLRSLTGRMR